MERDSQGSAYFEILGDKLSEGDGEGAKTREAVLTCCGKDAQSLVEVCDFVAG